MNQLKVTLFWQGLLLLGLAVLATALFEHSQLDIAISQLFYNHGHWLIEKGAEPFAFIFYDCPKMLISLFGLVLMLILIWRYWQDKRAVQNLPVSSNQRRLFQHFNNRELGFLLVCLIVVPSVTASLKAITHVSCPHQLLLFNGKLEYLTIWQNILGKTPAKCFPAAHASAGFSLFGLAYLPSLHRYQWKIFSAVTLLAWLMGLYKMAIGDHFFSHTLVSMLLSWGLVCVIASYVFNTTRVTPVATKNKTKRDDKTSSNLKGAA